MLTTVQLTLCVLLQLMRAHSERSQIIKRCISEVSDIVNTLRQQRKSGVDDPAVTMKLRTERNKVFYLFVLLVVMLRPTSILACEPMLIV